MIDLLRLPDSAILDLVRRVKCYPLLLKWSIGKVYLGADIQSSFSEIYSGTSEIAEFTFNDVFVLLTDDSKSCLYSMIIYGEKPISRPILQHLTNLEDFKFDDAIRELIITSFIYPESLSTENGVSTNFHMLSLTRGFIQSKLDGDQKEYNIIQTRFFELSRQIEGYEISQRTYHQSMISLGIKTDNEKIAFNYVKSAKYFFHNEEFEKAKENYENAIQAAPNFSYALIEYAKFEFSQRHIQNSENLFIKAINRNPDNYHAYFSYGITLRKLNKIQASIENFKEALRLNPTHLPIYNELGRAYTFNGEYDKANEQFEKASQQEKYPNYRHKFITLQHQADNFRRWSNSFFRRNDFDRGMEKLNQALETIQKANKLKEGDLRSQRQEKRICLQIAINLCLIGSFEDSKPYYKRCFKKIRLRNGMIVSNDEEMAQAYYNFAKYGFKLKTLELNDVNNFIKKGLATTKKVDLTNKLKILNQKVNKDTLILPSDRKHGIIKYFNTQRKYGLIDSEDQTYLFLKNGFSNYLDDSQINGLEGKEVSFILVDNPEKRGEKMAKKIYIESE